MGMSARKRRSRRDDRRLGRKQFRAAEKALLRGDRTHKSHFTDSWAGGGIYKGRNLPYT